jgi:2-isopropylmalate synthase
MDPNYVRIFDTTLRDGEQSPGATMTTAEKLEIARMLSRLGVDVIEAGFPAASDDDFEAVRSIAESVGREVVQGRPQKEPPTICGLARAVERDIERSAKAVSVAKHGRIHTFIATSDLHIEHKLRTTRADVLKRADAMVRFARTLCADIEFSPEDAGRSDHEFLVEVVHAAIEAGATTINIPDTVGYLTPAEYGALIALLKERVPGSDRAIFSVHCHNDLGMATANTLAGLAAGARQAEVTINGLGERAGNAAVEEVVMALATRKQRFGLVTGIDSTQLVRASKLVSQTTGFVVQPNKAVVGANAFAHESGIHQDGMLKNGLAYEIMRPESVGAGKTQLVLGKHSGRHAVGTRLAELGHALEGAALDRVFERFKTLADKKKSVSDADLEALVHDTHVAPPDGEFELVDLMVSCGTQGLATATVRVKCPDGNVAVSAIIGSGPVDAAFKAIDAIVDAPVTLLEYLVHAVTEGIDALGEVSVRIREGEGATVYGNGADTDIVVASAKAYLKALNKVVAGRPIRSGRMERIALESQASGAVS